MSFIEQQLATSTIDAFLGDAKPPTASMKKLIKSPFFDLFGHDLTSNKEEDVSTKVLEAPTMLLEEGAIANALRTAFVCKHCNSGKMFNILSCARICACIPLWFVRTVKPQRRLFLHMLVKVIGMLLTFDLLLLK